MSHTEGPWETVEGRLIAVIQTVDSCECVCDVQFKDARKDGAEVSANARLIAAAPEMLEALKSVCNYLDGLKGPFNHELLNLKDVIAKAEGKS